MLFNVYHYGTCAFTIKGNTLSLVNVLDDSVVTVLDDNLNIGNDFAIFVKDESALMGNKYEPSIWIFNNGNLKVYNNVSSSVSSISIDEKDSKKYNMGGIEVIKPNKEIYIQESKKIMGE